jgi:hypothetical protein
MNVSRSALSTFFLSKLFFLNDEQHKFFLQELDILIMKNCNLWIMFGSSV